MNKRYLTLISIFLLIGIGSCEMKDTDSQQPTATRQSQEHILVETVVSSMKNFQKELRVVGTVEPLQFVDVLPLESGQTSRVLVDIGDRVTKGDLLVVLDNPIIERNVEALKVEASAAEKHLARMKAASKAALGLISASELNNAEASAARATSALNTGLDRLRFLEVKAPISGVITQRNIHPGAVVENGLTSPNQTPMLTIVSCADIRVLLPYPERDMRFIYKDADIELNFPDMNLKLNTKVSRVSAAINPDSRTVDVFVDISSPDCSIRPGIYVEGTLMGGSRDSLMSLPAGVRFVENGLPFASAVIQGVVKKIPLTILAEDKNSIAFSAVGIDASTQFIITGRNLVTEGETVSTKMKK